MSELKRSSRDVLVRRLKGEGFKFSEFSVVSEGDYAIQDSDWNYKDIPHLHYVHSLAEAMPAVITRDLICTINLQSILGIWFPITLVNYEFERFRQVYFTTLFFFALVVETRSEPAGDIRARVTTTYSIGYPGWLWFAVPLLRRLIKRNYAVLMSEDLPMRDRRGDLRKLGYRFRMRDETYGFSDTINVMESNLLLPVAAVRRVACRYMEVLGESGQGFFGDIGLLGYRLYRDGADVVIFPRACPHEGAGLDDMDCGAGSVRCYWHGRRIKPVGRFRSGEDAEFATETHRVRVAGGELTIDYLGPGPEPATSVAAEAGLAGSAAR